MLDLPRTTGLRCRAGRRGWLPYLRQLHLHVGEHVEEAHDGVPEPAVGQALLVAGAGALQGNTRTASVPRTSQQ